MLRKSHVSCYYFVPGWVRGNNVCLYVCLSVCLVSARIFYEPHVQTSRNFLYMLAVVVARSFSDDNAIRYVFPVLWMFAPTGQPVTPRGGECTCPPRALRRHYALFSRASAVDECIRCRERWWSSLLSPIALFWKCNEHIYLSSLAFLNSSSVPVEGLFSITRLINNARISSDCHYWCLFMTLRVVLPTQ